MAYIKWINGLKGILCILIILYHYTARYSDLYGIMFYPSFVWGAEVGVTSFMLISGYLTMSTIQKLYVNRNIWLLNKYTRLWPAYYVCIIVTFVSLKLFGLPGRDSCTIIQLVEDFFMLPFVSGHIEGATWYIMALIQFYIIIYIISYVGKFDSLFFQSVMCVLFCLANIFPTIGTLLGKYPLYMGAVIQDKRYLPCLLIYLLLCFSQSIIILSTAVAIFALFALQRYSSIIYYFLSCKLLSKIGTLSYVWYLIHQNVGYIIMNGVKELMPLFLLPYFALIITFFIAFFLNNWIVPIVSNKLEDVKSLLEKYV